MNTYQYTCSFAAVAVLLITLPLFVTAQNFQCSLEMKWLGGDRYRVSTLDGGRDCDDVLDDFGVEEGEVFEIDPLVASYYGGNQGEGFTIGFNEVQQGGTIDASDFAIAPGLDSILSGSVPANNETEASEESEEEDAEDDAEIISLQLQIIELLQQIITLLSSQTLPQSSVEVERDVTTAVFKTSQGDFELELYTELMPITTENFITLAESGFYDGTLFHRVISDFMIQGGDPNTKTSDTSTYGTGGPGYTIEDEFVTAALLTNTRGSIAMANTGTPDSGGSQFFINVADNQNLDFDKTPLSSSHPVFGRIISGMEVVDAIAVVETSVSDLPVVSVVISDIEINK